MRASKSVLAIACIVSATFAGAAEPAPLRSAAAVRALSHSQAALKPPVDIQATVTYFRWFEGTLFVQQGDTGVYINAKNDADTAANLRLQPGDIIHVRGVAGDSFNPIIVSSSITLVGHGKLPDPLPVTIQPLMRADYDCRWVKVRGTVILAEMGTTSGHPMTHLVLGMDGGTADIVMDSNDAAQLEGLLDAEVEMTAVAGETFDGKMQQTGVRLHVPSFAYVRVLKRSAIDPWSVPLTSMDKVLRGFNDRNLTPRVRVEGTLTYYHPAELAILQEGDQSIPVHVSQIDRLDLGEKVEAIGIPDEENRLLSLKLGRVRPEGPGTAIQPKAVTWDEVATGKYSFNLVSIEGTVVTQVQEHSRDVYVISTGSQLFTASLRHSFPYVWPPPQTPPPMREFPPGSRVRVTGVAMVENGNAYSGPIDFSILLRSADEITVLTNPPWLNVRHLTEVVIVLLLVIFAVIVWSWKVERNARREIAGMAYIEQQRARIMELINSARPLAEILEEITRLISTALKGAPSWCQIADGATLGNRPPDLSSSTLRIIAWPIPSRSGAPLGTVYAAFHVHSKPQEIEASTMRMAAGLARLAIETSQFYSDLVHRSEFDLLTNVNNRFSMERFLDAQILAARQSAGIFGLLYLDLDRFKQLNDEYGHHVGDLYLQEAARRIKKQLRPGDMLARMGGDEFAALIVNVHSREDMDEVANRIGRCFNEPFVLDEIVLYGSASVGVALYPEDGTTKESLLIAADAAMYVAKHTRRQP